MCRCASKRFAVLLVVTMVLPTLADQSYSPPVNDTFPTSVYWGDTHVHTSFSWDAWSSWNRISPDDAYRFAKGETIVAHNGQKVRLHRPLDFLVVTDHAENMGYMPMIAGGDPAALATAPGRRTAKVIADSPSPAQDILTGDEGEAFARLFNRKFAMLSRKADTNVQPGQEAVQPAVLNKTRTAGKSEFSEKALNRLAGYSQDTRGAMKGITKTPGLRRSVWEQVTANAERHNRPGHFTAFIGYEWTFGVRGKYSSLHRNVIFADDATRANQILPLRASDSEGVEDLWRFLSNYQNQTGGRALAIPHNGNLSNGGMFNVERPDGSPISKEYAAARSRWEPVYEVTQIKGDGETHPQLSPTDEFADYETWNGFDMGNWQGRLESDYARSGLKTGLAQQAKLGENPFKFGMIGSTDTHTSLATADEDNFWGKGSLSEPSRHRIANAWFLTASGYAAVWATENTRSGLFDAMQRREVYATTGPRITLRVFGGWDYTHRDALEPNLALIGYRGGVPMGGDLTRAPETRVPSFLIRATRDADGANLDRVQVVKGWLAFDGMTHEKIYNAAVSNGRMIDAKGQVDPVGNTVDGAWFTNAIGDPELSVVWVDPDFDPDEAAFYYVRVLEIPTPRWTAYDTTYFDLQDLPKEIQMVTQERAYSSPIWYTP